MTITAVAYIEKATAPTKWHKKTATEVAVFFILSFLPYHAEFISTSRVRRDCGSSPQW